jgi:hypothetical protein
MWSILNLLSQRLKEITFMGAHIYQDSKGITLPGVTEILGIIQMDDNLMKLANSLGYARRSFDEMMDTASFYGEMVHRAIEADRVHQMKTEDFIKKEEYNDVPDKVKEKVLLALDHFRRRIMNEKIETLYMESPVLSTTLGYAGTIDWLCKWNGVLTMVDLKTAKKLRNTMFLQLGAYNNLLMDMGVHVEVAGIMTVNEQMCLFYPIDKKQLMKFGDVFNILADFYKKFSPLYQAKYSAKTPL